MFCAFYESSSAWLGLFSVDPKIDVPFVFIWMSIIMIPSKVSCHLIHHGAAASSSSKVVVSIPANSTAESTEVDRDRRNSTEIVYASHAMVNVAHQIAVETATNKIEHVWTVHQTLRTQTTVSSTANSTVATATAKRVVTSIARLSPGTTNHNNNHAFAAIICGFSDGTITSWTRQTSGTEWTEKVLHHESIPSVDTTENHWDGRSITDLCGRVLANGRWLVVTCTSSGAEYYEFDINSVETNAIRVQQTHLVTHPCSSVTTRSNADGSTWLLVGTAAPRHNKIHVYMKYSDDMIPHYCGPLTGHEDWVTCFDWCQLISNATQAMLASGSHDARIRLWKFTTSRISIPMSEDEDDLDTPALKRQDSDEEDHDVEDDDEADEKEEGEARLEVQHNKFLTSVTLDALLIGHEERVTSLAWHPNPEPIYGQELILISSSMDRAIFIWSQHENGVWTPISRVGSAGGILGGSIGSTLLGFLNTLIEPIYGRWLLGHAYGGALHFFSSTKRVGDTTESDYSALTAEELAALHPWRAQPCLTGHFEDVTDLCWEAESGKYLITVSNDQTSRVWAPIPRADKGVDNQSVWVEIARPQVHGYNLSAVTSLSTPDHPHLLVSGADEKELRVFDAPRAFLRTLHLVSSPSAVPADDPVQRVERAYIPSLGLSNKATAADGADEDTSGVSEADTQLPLERDLGAVLLWPEVGKLYGHNTELTRLASTVSAQSGTLYPTSKYAKDVLVASSAKARDVDAACIRIWNVQENRCLQVLKGGHKSTVAALNFSPDGKYLASSGKDRRLCIWRRSGEDGIATNQDLFYLAAAVDIAHKRIVWSVHFCPFHPSVMASGSRDGTLKIWRVTESLVNGTLEANLVELMKFSPVTRGSADKPESVTSVAFAPIPLPSRDAAMLAIGLENGMIELWRVPLADDQAAELCTCFPPSICHISTVTKLAWRPYRDELEPTDNAQLILASSSSDHGCRLFHVSL